MNILGASTCITTDHVAELKHFFITHFQSEVTFDCGWYVNLAFGSTGASLQLMSPQDGQPAPTPAGLMLNFAVEDVDAEHRALVDAGIPPCMPIEDHPWGDRGFAVQAPGGLMVYLYADREPSEEFARFYVRRAPTHAGTVDTDVQGADPGPVQGPGSPPDAR